MTVVEFYSQVYDILIQYLKVNKSEDAKLSFVYSHQYDHYSYNRTEYRINGILGFGCKFIDRGYNHNNNDRFHVNFYPEDEHKNSNKICELVNDQIKELWVKFQQESSLA